MKKRTQKKDNDVINDSNAIYDFQKFKFFSIISNLQKKGLCSSYPPPSVSCYWSKNALFLESHKNISREAFQNQIPVYNVYTKQCAFMRSHPLKNIPNSSKIFKMFQNDYFLASRCTPNIPKQ